MTLISLSCYHDLFRLQYSSITSAFVKKLTFLLHGVEPVIVWGAVALYTALQLRNHMCVFVLLCKIDLNIERALEERTYVDRGRSVLHFFMEG